MSHTVRSCVRTGRRHFGTDPLDVAVLDRAAAGQAGATGLLDDVVPLHRVADEGQDHQENHRRCHGTNYATVDIQPTSGSSDIVRKDPAS
jgi:hypothetical protein